MLLINFVRKKLAAHRGCRGQLATDAIGRLCNWPTGKLADDNWPTDRHYWSTRQNQIRIQKYLKNIFVSQFC